MKANTLPTCIRALSASDALRRGDRPSMPDTMQRRRSASVTASTSRLLSWRLDSCTHLAQQLKSDRMIPAMIGQMHVLCPRQRAKAPYEVLMTSNTAPAVTHTCSIM